MADNVNLSASIRTNLLSLQSTNALFERTSQRLSTGLKINSALDGASPFFTARSLNNRASDLTSLKDGIGQAIQTLKAADKGIVSLTALVEQAKSLGDQAKEASTQTTATSSTAATAVTTAGATFTTGFAAGTGTFTIAVTGAATTEIAVTGATTIASAVAAITAADTSITATFNTTTQKIDVTGTSGTTVTISGLGASGLTLNGTTTFGSTGSGATVSSLEADFEKVLGEINKLYTDSGYKGINLLNGNNLTVTTNENASTLVISGTTLNVTGLNFTAATVDWSVAANIDTSITEASSGLSTLRSTASSFSTDLNLLQTRDTFTQDLISTLESGAGLLVNANLEEESANLLALQTRQALGTSALSFANQAQQSILQLFR